MQWLEAQYSLASYNRDWSNWGELREIIAYRHFWISRACIVGATIAMRMYNMARVGIANYNVKVILKPVRRMYNVQLTWPWNPTLSHLQMRLTDGCRICKWVCLIPQALLLEQNASILHAGTLTIPGKFRLDSKIWEYAKLNCCTPQSYMSYNPYIPVLCWHETGMANASIAVL